MLTLDDLKSINRIPNESEISLKLYADFFDKYLCNRFYNIYLENNIKLTMHIAQGNYPHLIALNKFKADPHFKGNPLLKDKKQLEKYAGFCNLKYGKISLDDLKSINKIYYTYKTRILASPLIYQLLRNSEFFLFNSNNVVGTSTIKANHMFVSDIDKNKLHLFIKDNNGTNYPVSFISRSYMLTNDQLDYFINGQVKLKIIKIEVIDFKSKDLLETIIPGQNIIEKEVAATIDIKDKIINIYADEDPSIKYISDNTAHIINNINIQHGKDLSLKEIKQMYKELGNKLENSNNKDDLQNFNTLKEVIDDMKQAQLKELQNNAKAKAEQAQLNKSDLELE